MCGNILVLMAFPVRFWRIVPPCCLVSSTPSFRPRLAYRKSLPCGKRLLSYIPKKYRPASPNDFRPVALISEVMKSFEKTHQNHDMNRTDHLLDTLQFAHRHGWRVEDTVATMIKYVLCHLQEAQTHARVFYLDMSSAFKTLQPRLLLNKYISEFKF